MTAKKAEAKDKLEATEAKPSPKATDGGLTALQEQADADTARGFKGPEKEK
jgi:hypothetical protein